MKNIAVSEVPGIFNSRFDDFYAEHGFALVSERNADSARTAARVQQ